MDAQMVRRGKSLPKLANPAGPAQILDGFQALDGAGRVLTGSLPSFRFSNAKIIDLSKATVVSVAQYPLLVLMAVDYLSGVLVAIKNRKLSSQVGFVGLAKKVIVLLLVVVGNVLDVYVIGSGSVVRGMVIAFYLANEGLSILENAGNLGVKYPDKLRDVLAQLGEDK